MYSSFTSFGAEYNFASAFQSPSHTSPGLPQLTSRRDGAYKGMPPSYEQLLKNALNIVDDVNTEPIILDTEKAFARFIELKTSLKTQIELQAKQNEALELFTKQLSVYRESSYFLVNNVNNVDEFKEDMETRMKKVQEFTTYMDTFTSKMVAKLQENIDKTSVTINEINDKLASFAGLLKENIKGILSTEELKDIESGRQCSICVTNTVNRVLDTCGHTLCSTCEPNLTSGTCHICRASFGKINKLYL